MLFVDTETCGFHGPIVLIQYAFDEGEIQLYSPWQEPITDTLILIEKFCEHTVVGFNLAFDWFHLQRLYTMFLQYPDHSIYPIDDIDGIALGEPASMNGPCIKPKGAFDLMLHARKGPYQSTMDRGDIRIRRVPSPLAWKLAEHLTENIKFKDIYFARKKDKKERWKVYDIENDLGMMDTNFKDIVLKFAPSSALKALATDALGYEEDILKFNEVICEVKVVEKGWAPYALAVGRPGAWRGAWPDVINLHDAHWRFNALAKEYAKDDVVYTRSLFHYFNALHNGLDESESQEYSTEHIPHTLPVLHLSDDDSILACMVGSVRWHGFKLDLEALERLRVTAQDKYEEHKGVANNPRLARIFLEQHMDEMDKLVIKDSTKRTVLEEISLWESDSGEGLHPAAKAALTILDARKAKKKLETIDKLLQAKRFHASFKVIGTLSSRMAGTDGLNAQGIGHGADLRSCFTLADESMVLSGGDFVSFEVVLADAEYNDDQLHSDLLSGQKVHALLGQFFYPDMSYDEIMKSKGTDNDKYSTSKQGVFALIYGGEGYTLSTRVGINEQDAEAAYQAIIKRYPGIGKARKKVFEAFCPMTQPGGIGSRVIWKDPARFVESMLGFKRYFTMENKICKTLFDLAESPPKEWLDIKIKVVRRDRTQTAVGATRSAIFGAAFQIQAANMRAAANHRIQSTGAQITKNVERRIWDLQPVGVHPFKVLPMNIHDEIMAPNTDPDAVNQVVSEAVEYYREKIPLIEIEWFNTLTSWAEK